MLFSLCHSDAKLVENPGSCKVCKGDEASSCIKQAMMETEGVEPARKAAVA